MKPHHNIFFYYRGTMANTEADLAELEAQESIPAPV